jgi:hypothetical protein
VVERPPDAKPVEPVRALALVASKLQQGAQLLGALEQRVAQLEADVEIQVRRGDGIVELDLALHVEFAVGRLGLHALQAA